MITYSMRNGNLQFWISGVETPENEWKIAATNLPVERSKEDGSLQGIKIPEEQTTKGVMLKAVLAFAREQGLKAFAAKVTLKEDGTTNIVKYDVYGLDEATKSLNSISEKEMAAFDKYGYDIKRSQCWNGFPEDKIFVSKHVKEVFNVYGVDIASHYGVEIPLKTEEDLRKEAKERKLIKKQKRSLTSLGEYLKAEE